MTPIVPFVIGALSLVAVTAAVLDGPLETLAVIVESLWIFLVGRLMIRRDAYVPVLLIPFIFPIILSLSSIQSAAWQRGMFHLDALVLEAMIGASCLVAWYLSHEHHTIFSFRSDTIDDLEHAVWLVAVLYGLVFVWLVGHALFPHHYEIGTIFSITLYTLIAVFIYIAGRVLAARWRTVAAGVVAGLLLSLMFVTDANAIGTSSTIAFYIFVLTALGVLTWLERAKLVRRNWLPR